MAVRANDNRVVNSDGVNRIVENRAGQCHDLDQRVSRLRILGQPD
jgi:hypothetical protein